MKGEVLLRWIGVGVIFLLLTSCAGVTQPMTPVQRQTTYDQQQILSNALMWQRLLYGRR